MIKFLTKKSVLTVLACLLSVSALVWLMRNSGSDFLRIWRNVNNIYLSLAFLVSGVIYVFMGLSLRETLKLLGQKINLGAAVSIAFVSTTVNYLVSSMGVSGFALRAHLLGRRHIPLGASVVSSVVISVLLYFTLIIIILQGSLLLLFSGSMPAGHMPRNFSVAVGIVFIGALVTMFLFNSDLRYKAMRKTFILLNKIVYGLFGRIIPKNNYSAFAKQLDNGVRAIHRNKAKLTKAIVYICCDWVFTILILYLAFLAVGVRIPIGVLLAGFAVGMATTLIPVLPGGLGAMELAMSGVFSQTGIDFDAALMASLIYRFAYYIVPGIISVFVYWGLKLSEPGGVTKGKTKAYLQG